MSDDFVDFSYEPSSQVKKTQPQKRQTVATSIPSYQGIVQGAGVLNFVAGIYLLIAVIVAIIFVLAGAYGFVMGNIIGGGIAIAGAVIYACFSYAVYAVLRLLPSCALALRDMARNSWR